MVEIVIVLVVIAMAGRVAYALATGQKFTFGPASQDDFAHRLRDDQFRESTHSSPFADPPPDNGGPPRD